MNLFDLVIVNPEINITHDFTFKKGIFTDVPITWSYESYLYSDAKTKGAVSHKEGAVMSDLNLVDSVLFVILEFTDFEDSFLVRNNKGPEYLHVNFESLRKALKTAVYQLTMGTKVSPVFDLLKYEFTTKKPLYDVSPTITTEPRIKYSYKF